MPRKALFKSNEFPYHVFNRSNNKEWFYIPIESAWRIFLHVLTVSSELYQTEIHTFVLMSNHYHLILSTPKGNLDAFMRHFQTEVCRRVQRESNRINHVFGNRYKWTVLETPVAFSYAHKYVLRNPVRAKLSESAETYRYSSLRLLLDKNCDLPLTERRDWVWSRVPVRTEEFLNWLALPVSHAAESQIARALRRFHFRFSRGNDVRKDIEELRSSYGVEIPGTFPAGK